jgi:membrane protein
MISKILNFLKTDIWRLRLKNLPRAKSFFIKQLRIIVLAVRGFAEDKCKFRASALTFFTLLSVVPIIALMFGIAKGFGLEGRVEKIILNKMAGHDEIAGRIINFSNSLLENAKGGIIAGIGVVFLLWAVIKLLGNVENSFNDIWGIKKPRHIGRKFSDYLSVILVCPILLVIASSATIIISTKIKSIFSTIPVINSMDWLIIPVLKLLPFCSVWLIFTFIFIFMPNTKVNFKSALLAGIVAGTIFQIVQWAYINFQVGAAKYGAIYGSFAALPLFLIWLQLSWYIVLFGAELSFAHQNVDTYEFEPDCLSVSNLYKRQIALLISSMLAKNFATGQRPLYAIEISQKLEIPIRLVRQVMFELVEAGVVSEVRAELDRDAAYQPARDIETMTIKFVIDSLESRGSADIPVAATAELEKIGSSLKKFAEEIEKSPANKLLKDI